MRVMIATPTTNGITTASYSQSLVAATTAITKAGGTYQLLTIDGADVVMARNLLAHRFMADASNTHILFIDSDMAIDLTVFRHLLQQDKPIIGTAYTERQINLVRFAEAMGEENNMRRARALASNFTLRMEPGEKTVRDNLVEVNAFGFGCVLIKREVFEALNESNTITQFRSNRLRDAGLRDTILNYFDPIPVEDGQMLSEDYSFCSRIRQLGRYTLWAYVGPGVGHTGAFTYGAPYVERMKAGKT